jgi:hypothetical protein
MEASVVKLQDCFPQDHRLNRVYRCGAALTALLLSAFGITGLLGHPAFFGTGGAHILGLSGNGLLSVVSITAAAVLLAAAVIGGSTASTVNLAMGALFYVGGFVHLALLGTGANVFAFRLPDVMASFAVGVVLLFFGAYGRIAGALPHDNPYWMARHAHSSAPPDTTPPPPAIGRELPESSPSALRTPSPARHERPRGEEVKPSNILRPW